MTANLQQLAVIANLLESLQAETPPPTQRLLTCPQACEYLGISKPTLYGMKVTRIKIGGATRWDIKDLDNFIEKARSGK